MRPSASWKASPASRGCPFREHNQCLAKAQSRKENKRVLPLRLCALARHWFLLLRLLKLDLERARRISERHRSDAAIGTADGRVHARQRPVLRLAGTR